jgi:hypothetical protein
MICLEHVSNEQALFVGTKKGYLKVSLFCAFKFIHRDLSHFGPLSCSTPTGTNTSLRILQCGASSRRDKGSSQRFFKFLLLISPTQIFPTFSSFFRTSHEARGESSQLFSPL